MLGEYYFTSKILVLRRDEKPKLLRSFPIMISWILHVNMKQREIDRCLHIEIVLMVCLVQIIEQFQKCHLDHPIGKFFGECTDLKIKLDHCFRQEKALKRKANFEESKKLKERLQAHRKEIMREDLK
ncbi:hypothetical protein HYC85_010004 [Camellia sinensis]|uniref:COX assembly mitochondrial protein n=1 Tax=Camellia sinensis TaxID=4442 RepID=A0A7J7HGM6_CAMSI|nr:hypothetical protein HYC85_010004 [Camellia sinensis]